APWPHPSRNDLIRCRCLNSRAEEKEPPESFSKPSVAAKSSAAPTQVSRPRAHRHQPADPQSQGTSRQKARPASTSSRKRPTPYTSTTTAAHPRERQSSKASLLSPFATALLTRT